jgi:general secretion pathway protein C
MKPDFKSLSWMSWFVPLLVILGFVKLVWVLVETVYLPTKGIEPPNTHVGKSLYQPYRLASNEALRPIKKKAPPKKKMNLLRDMKLLGVYQGPEHHIAVIAKGSKHFVVYEGEELLGYHVESVDERSVTLIRGVKSYRLELPKSKVDITATTGANHRNNPKMKVQPVDRIIDEDGNKLVPRAIIDHYVSDTSKIWKNIGIDPYKKGEMLQGFKVRFVRRCSDFAKLGLKRGDIITAINGESIVDYATPIELMKNIDKLEGLTLQIQRGKEELEIDYEVR